MGSRPRCRAPATRQGRARGAPHSARRARLWRCYRGDPAWRDLRSGRESRSFETRRIIVKRDTLGKETPAVVVVAGPTASGKSGLALALAREFDGVVINADAIQVYRELSVLTARPTAADMTAA